MMCTGDHLPRRARRGGALLWFALSGCTLHDAFEPLELERLDGGGSMLDEASGTLTEGHAIPSAGRDASAPSTPLDAAVPPDAGSLDGGTPRAVPVPEAVELPRRVGSPIRLDGTTFAGAPRSLETAGER